MDDFKRAMENFQEQFQAVLSMIETQAEQIHENMLVLKDDLERLRSIDVEDDMEADSAHFEDASESEGINSEADSFPSLCDDVNNSVSLVNENEMHLEVENSAYKVFDESPEIISDEIRTEIEAQFSDIYICETILRERLAQKIAIHEVSDVIVEMDDSKNLFSRHFKDEVGSLSLDVLVENSSGEVIAFQFRSDIVYFDDFWGQISLKGGVLGREMVIECFGWKPGWVLVIRTMDRELFVINTRKIWTKKRWLLSFVFEWKPGLRCSSMGKLRKELKNGWKDGEVGVIKNDMIQVVFSGFELHELQELKSVMSDLVMQLFQLLCCVCLKVKRYEKGFVVNVNVKSSIIVIGLSICTCSVEMREKLATQEAGWPKAFKEPCTLKHIKEAIVLCTCNQMETCVVALSQHRGVKEVTRGILKIGWISVTANSGHFFLLGNNEATHHVFEVLARLDSLVRAQVKQVTKVIQGVPGFRRTISGLFKHTIMSLGVQAFQKELLEARGTALGVKEVLEAIKRLHKLCTDFGGSIDEIHFLFSSFFAFFRAKMILHSTTIGKIHSTFHVSLLKQAHGTRIPTGPLPKSPRFFLQPRAVLHTQVIKKGNKAVAKILVHWEGLSISEASWEVLGRYAMLNVNTVMESNDKADANVIDHCEIEIVESQFVGFLMTSKLMFCGRSDGAYLQMRYSAFSTERAEPECEIDAFNLHSSGLPNKRGTRIQKFKLHSSRLPNKKGTRIQKFKLHSSRLPNKKGIRIQKHLKDWFWLFFELHRGNCEVASLDDVEKRVPAFDFED